MMLRQPVFACPDPRRVEYSGKGVVKIVACDSRVIFFAPGHTLPESWSSFCSFPQREKLIHELEEERRLRLESEKRLREVTEESELGQAQVVSLQQQFSR